jgi:hypothetical protein
MSLIHSIEPEELMAYLDGELPASRAAEVAAHVERCVGCKQFAVDFGGVSQRLLAWQVEPADPGMPARIVEALGEGLHASGTATKQRMVRWSVPFRWALGVAAVIAVVLILATPRADRMIRPASARLTRQRVVAESLPLRPGLKLMVERRAQLVLTVPDFDKARAEIETIVRRHGGYAGALTVTSPSAAARTLDTTLRVPADQLDTVLTELKTLGRVEEESQSGEEVTGQYGDLEARLANARNTENRLTDLLRERTGKLSDVLEVEQQLSRVRGEVEQMEAQRKNLANLVEFATVSVRLTEDYKAPLGGASRSALTRLRNAAVEGYRSAAEGVVGVIALLFSYGPGLAIWAVVLYFPVRIVWKKLRPRV